MWCQECFFCWNVWYFSRARFWGGGGRGELNGTDTPHFWNCSHMIQVQSCSCPTQQVCGELGLAEDSGSSAQIPPSSTCSLSSFPLLCPSLVRSMCWKEETPGLFLPVLQGAAVQEARLIWGQRWWCTGSSFQHLLSASVRQWRGRTGRELALGRGTCTLLPPSQAKPGTLHSC